jgi:flagellin
MTSLISGIGSISTRTKFGDKVLLGASTTDGVDPAATARYRVQVSNDAGDTISLTNDAFRTLGTGSAASTEETTITLTSNFISGQVITVGGRSVTVAGTGTTADQVVTLMLQANGGVVGTGTTAGNNGTPAGAVGNNFTLSAGATANSFKVTNLVNTAVTDVVVSSSGNPGFTVSTVQGSAAGTGQTTGLSAAIASYLTALNGGLPGGATEDNYIAGAAAVQAQASAFLLALNTQRSKLGALQNQMESTVDNVQELSSNLSSARSRIQDTDYATETAALTKGQILQQAATAMLAQANQMPNVILSLLK